MKDLSIDVRNGTLLTHKDCLDGAGCSIIWNAAGGNDVVYVPAGGLEAWSKKAGKDLLESGRPLVICDLGFESRKLADRLEKRGNVVFLDHHATSVWLADRPWCEVDTGACGAELLRRRLFPDREDDSVGAAFKELADIVDDQDRWLLKRLPVSQQMMDLMNFYGQERFVQSMDGWYDRWEHGNFFYEEEKFALEVVAEKKAARFERLLKRARVVDRPWGKTAYFVSDEPAISLFLHLVLERMPDVEVVCLVSFERGTVGLRSRPGGPDCATIAQQFGGGGHVVAAGHALTKELVDLVLEEVHG